MKMDWMRSWSFAALGTSAALGLWLGCAGVDPQGAGLGGSSSGTSDGGDDGADGADGADSGDGGDDGADGGADTADHGSTYHPEGFADADVHGPAAKFATEDCRLCHGMELQGMDPAPSCDSCHQPEWRTNCTYCHGGTETDLGAPPRDIDGATALEELTFRSHTAHVTEGIKAALDCTHCHVKPSDVLSPGHLFDGTPGVAEVDFSHGLSPDATWSAGSCTNLYCHGNGNGTLGDRQDTQPAPGCGDCHADASTSGQWNLMSGEHPRHLGQNLDCSECHAATAGAGESIIQPLLHVDGQAEVVISASGFTYNAGTCSGTCHGKIHFAKVW